MNWIDITLLGVGIYLAIMFLVRLMRRKHDQLLASMRRQLQERNNHRHTP